MKIVYCLNSIKGIGGIQNVTIAKANALAEIDGNEVYIIVSDNQDNVQCRELSDKVNFIHLEVNYYDDDWIPGFRSKISQIKKKITHWLKLKKLMNQLKPDIVVAVGQSEKFICRKGLLKSHNAIYIRELHFVTHYRNVLANTNWQRLRANFLNFIDFKFFCKFFYDAIIPLTPKDLNNNWKNNKKAIFIPNPITLEAETNLQDKYALILNKEKKIIAVGRLTYIKNLKSLISAYSLIADDFPDWTLEIYGDGEDEKLLSNIIFERKLQQKIFLKGFTNNIAGVMKKSSILALTSIMEGFPLVLFEAMSLGNTIVSYDCDFGPSYIVDDHINGFLVDNGNEILFSEKLKKLMQNEDLRNKMAIKAIEKTQNFTPEIIAEQWMDLFRTLKANK